MTLGLAITCRPRLEGEGVGEDSPAHSVGTPPLIKFPHLSLPTSSECQEQASLLCRQTVQIYEGKQTCLFAPFPSGPSAHPQTQMCAVPPPQSGLVTTVSTPLMVISICPVSGSRTVILSPGEHLAMFRCVLVATAWGVLLLTSGGTRAGVLLNVLQCTGDRSLNKE